MILRERLGLLACRLGLHRMDARSSFTARGLETWNRCERVGCPYDHWMLVDVRPADARRGRGRA